MGGMCNFDFGVALCRRIWNSREEQGSRDGYTRHTIPTLYTRCLRSLKGVEVGQVTGLSGRVRQERGIVYGTLSELILVSVSLNAPIIR